MNDAYEDIIESCPNLYKECRYIECGPGWLKIIRDLSLHLEKMIVEGKWGDLPPAAFQVKQKMGELRFYMDNQTDAMNNLIAEAEILSEKTCERCGKEGRMRAKGFWFSTLCDVCAAGNT